MIFADRVHRFFKRLAEWYLDRDPMKPLPEEYERVVTEWANANPYATRSQWRHILLLLASQAYDDGYNRCSFEQDDLGDDFDPLKPERVADALDPGWRDLPMDLVNPDWVVPEEEPSEGIMTDDQLRRMTRHE